MEFLDTGMPVGVLYVLKMSVVCKGVLQQMSRVWINFEMSKEARTVLLVQTKDLN